VIGLCIREQKKAGEEQMKDDLEILTRGVENDAGLLAALAHPERGQVFA
jgi:hypothetical protein